MPTLPPLPDVYRRQDLLNHVRDILAFYHPRAIDPSGGLYHFFKDDGTVFDAHTRHLVSSTRYVFLWAMAARHFPDTPAYLDNARRAVNFLRGSSSSACTPAQPIQCFSALVSSESRPVARPPPLRVIRNLSFLSEAVMGRRLEMSMHFMSEAPGCLPCRC